MRAIITSVTDVSLNGEQSVVFDIQDGKTIIASSQSLLGDVDTIQDQIKQMLNDYAAKLKSIKRLKVGDVVNQ